MTSSPTTFSMSSKCKSFVVKKMYEHYMMNIFWKEVCQKISTICLFIFPTISFLSKNHETVQCTIAILSGLVSLIVYFFCDTNEYHTSLHIVTDVYTTNCGDSRFERKFEKLMPYIREIDYARGRSDYAAYCKELNIVQKPGDKLTKHDIDEMNRQRCIIAALCFMAASICSLLLIFMPSLDIVTKTIITFIIVSTIIGFVFMLIDCRWIAKRK